METKQNVNAGVALDNINNLQQMWNAVTAAYAAGTDDSLAMYNVYQVMSPRLSFQDISDVFSGVYIDTYWNITAVDPTVLAQHLVQGLGIDRGLALQYANNSVSQWRGPLLRKNISDVGTVPVVGDFTASLDIVCNGDGELLPQNLINNWNDTFWSQPKIGKNYIYARVQNAYFKGAFTPTTQMFYSTGGFNQPPTSWVQCNTAKDPTKQVGVVYNQQGVVAALNVGDRGCSEAFMFNPVNADHVCVIAAMATDYFTSNTPKDKKQGNFDSMYWITHNGGAAWHNVDPQLHVEDSLAFFNQDGSHEAFKFTLACQNVPVGSTIRLRSDDAALGFDTGDVKVVSSNQILSHLVTLPPNYEGALKIKLQDPAGNCLPVNAAAKLSMDWVVPVSHPRYADSVPLVNVRLLHAQQPLNLSLGSFTLTGSGRQG
jgi:hypothetical protein